MDARFDANRELWNRWTAVHERSAFYDVDAFRRGASTLRAVERDEVGPVAGRSLLHLQCHFGLDTLSWARLGARATGVDFSDDAVALARRLAGELAIDARFVQANVYDLPDVLPEEFDVVVTSYGVLAWLPDLPRWARVVARHLRPGGTFHIVEFHPAADMLDDAGERVASPYMAAEPLEVEVRGSYADRDAPVRQTSYQWAHGLGDVVTALLDAGLRLEFVREHLHAAHGCYPFTREQAPGVWRRPGPAVPLMFSIRATR